MNHDERILEAEQTEVQNSREMTQEQIDLAVDESEMLRRNFVSCVGEPVFTFNRLKIGVSTACVRKVEQEYIQILINRQKKLLIVRPCSEEEIHSFQWCTWKDGKKYPRQITAKIFYMKICSLMGWNPEYRYRIVGKFIHSHGQEMFLFDLTTAEVFQCVQADGTKTKSSHTPIYPLEWREQFGIPFEGHQKALQINLFDGYAVYSINDSPPDYPLPPALLNPTGNTAFTNRLSL